MKIHIWIVLVFCLKRSIILLSLTMPMFSLDCYSSHFTCSFYCVLYINLLHNIHESLIILMLVSSCVSVQCIRLFFFLFFILLVSRCCSTSITARKPHLFFMLVISNCFQQQMVLVTICCLLRYKMDFFFDSLSVVINAIFVRIFKNPIYQLFWLTITGVWWIYS